jgi:Zn-finger nucleic acid-binding protein
MFPDRGARQFRLYTPARSKLAVFGTCRGTLHNLRDTADYIRMSCENCGAPVRLSRDQGLMICDYCGSQATPRTDEDGVLVMDPTTHNCPVCATALADASIESHELLYCPRCHGMLFDMEKFLPLLDVLREYRYWSRSSQAPRDRDAGRGLRCPFCRHEMDVHPYGGGGNVVVDSCEPCNVLWLDRGELSRIVAAPDRDPHAAFQTYDAPGKSDERESRHSSVGLFQWIQNK